MWPRWLAASLGAVGHGLFPQTPNSTIPAAVPNYLTQQWQNPSDILSVLLLLGPDIVQRSVAQLAGRAITPVAFSFGWVAYSVSALLSAFGGNYPLILISPGTILLSVSNAKQMAHSCHNPT